MAAHSLIAIIALALAGVEVAAAARLHVAARRRGGGLVIGAVVTAVCAVLLLRTSATAEYVVLGLAQLVAVASLANLLTHRAPRDGASPSVH